MKLTKLRSRVVMGLFFWTIPQLLQARKHQIPPSSPFTEFEAEAKCSRVVSCADILALAASYAVFMAEGPEFLVPLGRRDSLTFANQTITVDSLPGPTSNVTVLMTILTEKGFDSFMDLVALSGGHTFGISHCASFVDRLYPTQDPTLSVAFAKKLEETCPTTATVNNTDLDMRTPKVIDKKYYIDLQSREGLLTSYQNLYNDSCMQHIVNNFVRSVRCKNNK